MPSVPDEQSTAKSGIRRRIAAYVLDTAVIGVVAGAVVSRRTESTPLRVVLTVVIGGILGFPYHVVFEGTVGRTVGKRACGLEVVAANGGSCSLTAATVRTVARLIDFLPAGYLLGLVSIRVTERDRRIGDLLAGTVVVRTEE